MQAFTLIAIVSFIATSTLAQLSIPARNLGFVYKYGQANAEVRVAVYIDLTCPDSQAAYTTLLTVTDQYTPAEVQLKVYLFSLPYHRNSHILSKAANVINNYDSPIGATPYDWITTVYANINYLTTEATVNETDTDVLNILTNLAYNVAGITAQTFQAAIANTTIDQYTRLVWEYGCTRGVYGTPLFTVNDVFINADASWTVAQWTDLIQSLLF